MTAAKFRKRPGAFHPTISGVKPDIKTAGSGPQIAAGKPAPPAFRKLATAAVELVAERQEQVVHLFVMGRPVVHSRSVRLKLRFAICVPAALLVGFLVWLRNRD